MLSKIQLVYRYTTADVWGSVAAGTHWTCGVRGAPRQLVCWGVIRDYPAEVGIDALFSQRYFAVKINI